MRITRIYAMRNPHKLARLDQNWPRSAADRRRGGGGVRRRLLLHGGPVVEETIPPAEGAWEELRRRRTARGIAVSREPDAQRELWWCYFQRAEPLAAEAAETAEDPGIAAASAVLIAVAITDTVDRR